MRPPFPFLFLLVFGSVYASASHFFNRQSLSPRHNRIALRDPAGTNFIKKRCPNRAGKLVITHASATSTTAAHHTTSITTTSKKSKATSAIISDSNSGSGGSLGVIDVKSSYCGPSGATRKTTAETGPNGDINWLNCGITESSGWNPPYITIDEIITEDLSSAIQSSGTPFGACADYVHLFETYGSQNNIPAILLASFAMQESSCNPNTVGGAGEQGIMQLTKDKCTSAPDGNCKDLDYNIKTGARFFAQTLEDNGGSLLLAIGEYNGWYKGLTVAKATAAAHTTCCRCQQNLDYLHQFLNGWCQNLNAYSLNLGKYHNLNICGDD